MQKSNLVTSLQTELMPLPTHACMHGSWPYEHDQQQTLCKVVHPKLSQMLNVSSLAACCLHASQYQHWNRKELRELSDLERNGAWQA